jgi:hypothetical protein
MADLTQDTFTPAFTAENLATITAAIASGATQVQYGDKMVTYRSLKDLMELRQIMQDEINGGNVCFGRRTVAKYYPSK